MIDSINKINDTNNIEESKKAELDDKEKSTDLQIFEKYNCKDVSKDQDINNIKVNLSFQKDLYTSNKDNKKYFEDIVDELFKIYKKDFSLIDNKKDINIEVKKISENAYEYKINSLEDYFAETQKNNEEINNYKEIETIKNEVSYKDFNKFENNKWSVKAAGVKIQSTGDGFLDYGNYKILTDNIFINTIILESDFEDEIIGDIKVGEDLKSIENKLGPSQFKDSNMIGYKTNDEYIFFYTNQVAIYPNMKFSNSNLEKLIFKFINGEYEEERKNFAFEIVHEYLDFKSEVDENNTLKLTSPARGIQIQISQDNQITVNIYNNYDMTEQTKKYIRENKINAKLNEDLIYINETNRVK